MKRLLLSLLTLLLMTLPSASATTQVWNGSFDSNYWWGCLDLDGSVFSVLKKGDKVVLKANTNGTGKIQIANQDWSYFMPNNSDRCDEFQGSYTIDVRDDGTVNFFKGGIHIKGENFTLSSIVITGTSGGSTGGNTGAFRISGTQLLDANGNEFIMRGCNYAYAWQKGNEYCVIPAAKRIGCNTIRISIGNGRKFEYCSKTEIGKLIKLCEDNKLICVLCVHDPLGSDNIYDLDQAVEYWKSIKDAIVGHEKTVIMNIANEWVASWEAGANTWQEGYVKAVKSLRDAGFKNTLMIDCAGYGQYPAVIGNKGGAVVSADPLNNLMFSIHMYQYDAGTSDQVRSNIDQALSVGVPLCIGEFAYSHQGSDVAYQTIMDYCQQKRVGYLVWSWTGNGGGAEACDMFAGYDESSIRPNGEKTIWGSNGIKATSQECSVYGNESYGAKINGTVSNIGSVAMESSFDFNSPYEIYNMSGQKMDNMQARGIYILRQGTTTIKVRK